MAVLPGSVTVRELKNLERRPTSRGAFELAKRGLDLLLASVGLVLALPAMLVCMAIVKLSNPGPSILRQTRLGKDGRRFEMLKLRTMQVNAEADSGPVLACANDRRIIPACRWMRISHMDELPQLINVLRGEMSLVGPRPERPEIAEKVSQRLPEFRHRLSVLPGITGLAQVYNGYDTNLDDFTHKLNYDLNYIRRRSMALEFWILAKTATKFCDSTAR